MAPAPTIQTVRFGEEVIFLLTIQDECLGLQMFELELQCVQVLVDVKKISSCFEVKRK